MVGAYRRPRKTILVDKRAVCTTECKKLYLVPGIDVVFVLVVLKVVETSRGLFSHDMKATRAQTRSIKGPESKTERWTL